MKRAGWWIGFVLASALAYGAGFDQIGIGLPFVIGAIHTSPFGLILGLIWAGLASQDGGALLARLAVVLSTVVLGSESYLRPSQYGWLFALLYGLLAGPTPWTGLALACFAWMVLRSGERKLLGYQAVPVRHRLPVSSPRHEPARIQHRPFDA